MLENAPFISIYDEDKNKLNFLGTGYYFWDYNLSLAHKWGKMRYNGDYFVIEAQIGIQDSKLLDLVGSMVNIQYFRDIIQKFKNNGYFKDGWGIAKYIEFLKSFNKEKDYFGIFPFKAIKAIDTSIIAKKRYRFKFISRKPAYIDLDPRIMYCIIDLNEISLRDKKLINPISV